MNPFFSLTRLFRPPTPSQTSEGFEIPFGLTRQEFSALKGLMESEGWDALLKTLDASVKFHGEALIGASGDESLHFQRGVIFGIRKAAGLASDVKNAEKVYLNEQRNAAKRRESGGKSSALYGSPAWSNPNKRSA